MVKKTKIVSATIKSVKEAMPNKDFEEIAKLAKETIEKLVNKKPLSVISLNKENGNWVVIAEVLERAAIPDTQDLIGKYQLSFNSNKEFLGYKRIEIRKKGDTGKETMETEETQTGV